MKSFTRLSDTFQPAPPQPEEDFRTIVPKFHNLETTFQIVQYSYIMRPEYWGIPTVFTLLLASCGVTPAGPSARSFCASPAMTMVDPSFQSGLSVLGAFERDLVAETEEWALLGVKVSHPQGEKIWFVRLSTLQPIVDNDAAEIPSREFAVPFGMGSVKTGAKFTAPVSRLMIELYDHQGKLMRSSIRTVPQVESCPNLLDMLASAPASTRSRKSFDLKSAAAAFNPSDARLMKTGADDSESMPSLMTWMQLMGGSRALLPVREAIRDHVVMKPSILGLVLAGFKITLEAHTENRQRIGEDASAPKHEARFPVLLSGQRLFDCRVVVGPTASPYNLTAGALLVEAVHPEQPARRLTVSVLAAQKGAASKARESS